jgi:DNA-directed RNA polymerase subunit K/omega
MNSMALTSNQDAVASMGNIYHVVLAASCRYRELQRGYIPMINSNDSNSSIALQEIERGIVGLEYVVKYVENNRKQRSDNFKREQRMQAMYG